MSQLEKHGYLEEESHYGFHDQASFSITNDGILLIKEVLGELTKVVTDKNSFEQKIQTIEGNNEIKKWLKKIRDKLIDKTQDQIVDVIISGAKTYGPSLITFLITLNR